MRFEGPVYGIAFLFALNCYFKVEAMVFPGTAAVGK
jgi:hypothetical protein